MVAKDRQRNEQAFHNRQARERAAHFRQPESLIFDDDFYLDHETWVRPAIHQLGDVRAMPVLDFGCGHGMAAVVLARRGARVTAFDLSYGYLDEARARARANAVPVDFVKADGENLPFADRSAPPRRGKGRAGAVARPSFRRSCRFLRALGRKPAPHLGSGKLAISRKGTYSR